MVEAVGVGRCVGGQRLDERRLRRRPEDDLVGEEGEGLLRCLVARRRRRDGELRRDGRGARAAAAGGERHAGAREDAREDRAVGVAAGVDDGRALARSPEDVPRSLNVEPEHGDAALSSVLVRRYPDVGHARRLVAGRRPIAPADADEVADGEQRGRAGVRAGGVVELHVAARRGPQLLDIDGGHVGADVELQLRGRGLADVVGRALVGVVGVAAHGEALRCRRSSPGTGARTRLAPAIHPFCGLSDER